MFMTNINTSAPVGSTPPSNTTSVILSIEDIAALISELLATMDDLKDRKAQHLAKKPSNPGSEASDEAKGQYEAQLQAWQSEGAQISAAIMSLVEDLGEAVKKFEQTVNTELPRANNKDRRELEAQAKRLEEARKGASSLGANSDGVEDIKSAIKSIIKKIILAASTDKSETTTDRIVDSNINADPSVTGRTIPLAPGTGIVSLSHEP
jgi:hypothetical protein